MDDDIEQPPVGISRVRAIANSNDVINLLRSSLDEAGQMIEERDTLIAELQVTINVYDGELQLAMTRARVAEELLERMQRPPDEM